MREVTSEVYWKFATGVIGVCGVAYLLFLLDARRRGEEFNAEMLTYARAAYEKAQEMAPADHPILVEVPDPNILDGEVVDGEL